MTTKVLTYVYYSPRYAKWVSVARRQIENEADDGLRLTLRDFTDDKPDADDQTDLAAKFLGLRAKVFP